MFKTNFKFVTFYTDCHDGKMCWGVQIWPEMQVSIIRCRRISLSVTECPGIQTLNVTKCPSNVAPQVSIKSCIYPFFGRGDTLSRKVMSRKTSFLRHKLPQRISTYLHLPSMLRWLMRNFERFHSHSLVIKANVPKRHAHLI